jgi:hypothetical protein
MPIVTFPTIAPYNRVAVRSEQVFAATVDPQASDMNSELLVDAAGGRSILVLEKIDSVGAKLGAGFVALTTAAVSPAICYVNKSGWVSILPHPQKPGVCQIFRQARHVAVQGDLATITDALR